MCALFTTALIAVGLLYANVLRERTAYLDVIDYVQAAANLDAGQSLPPRYLVLFHRWFLYGIPGFGSVMIILYLMIAKPF